MYTLQINRNAFDGSPNWERTSKYPCSTFQDLIQTILDHHNKGTSYMVYKEEKFIWPGSDEFEEILKALHPEESEENL